MVGERASSDDQASRSDAMPSKTPKRVRKGAARAVEAPDFTEEVIDALTAARTAEAPDETPVRAEALADDDADADADADEEAPKACACARQ